MVTCGYCNEEGHSARSCSYKEKLPYIHAIIGDAVACGLEKLENHPEKIMLMEREKCPLCLDIIESFE